VPGEDVARQLGTTPAHVAVLLHRAKHSLKRCVGRAEALEAPPPPAHRSGRLVDQDKLRRAAG
jgi:hypothetical protein